MIFNKNQFAATIDRPTSPIEPKNTNIDSSRLLNINNLNSIAKNHINKSLNITKNNTENVKILKSFYKKDALASVTKSFLNLDENYSDLNSNEKENSIYETINKGIEKQSCLDFNSIQEE